MNNTERQLHLIATIWSRDQLLTFMQDKTVIFDHARYLAYEEFRVRLDQGNAYLFAIGNNEDKFIGTIRDITLEYLDGYAKAVQRGKL